MSEDPAQRGAADTLRPLLRLTPWVRPHAGTLAIGVLAFFVARLFEASVPLFLKTGIDRLAEGETDVLLPALGIAGAVSARFAVVSFARLQVRRAGLDTAFDLRNAFFQRLQRQGLRFYGQHSVGDMMTRAISDIALIQRLISLGTIMIVILLFATLVGFASMLWLSPSLTLAILPTLPVVFLYTWGASRHMNAASRRVQGELSALNTHVQESLSGIRTVQALVQEDEERRRFAAASERYARAFFAQARITSAMGAWMPTLASLATLVILGYGGHLVQSGAITVGTLAAFLLYVSMVVAPFRVAGWILNLMQRAGVAAERLCEILDLPDEIEEAPRASPAPVLDGGLRLEHVSFAYPGSDRPALADVSLAIAPGERIAVMGPIGSGKTTLLRLLVRLIEADEGTLTYTGRRPREPGTPGAVEDFPVAELPLGTLRRQVALVPQDAFLFAEAIGSNISYDQPERQDPAVWRAAERAALRPTLEALPERLRTLVGERGVTLSGGQRQRTTLARGLVRDPTMLLLDDCMSAVDSLTEAHILEALRDLRRGRSTVVVTHRIAVARTADRIVCLESGRVAAEGTHEELLRRYPPYATLAAEQLGGEGADDEAGRGPFPVERRAERQRDDGPWTTPRQPGEDDRVLERAAPETLAEGTTDDAQGPVRSRDRSGRP
jgi:ATP-binding cassette subfamily B multidrug efflux pump